MVIECYRDTCVSIVYIYMCPLPLQCIYTVRLIVSALPQLRVLPVDLSDMGEFLAAVRNRFVFVTCTSRCELKFHQGPLSSLK